MAWWNPLSWPGAIVKGLSGETAADAQREANFKNIELAREQMEFQRQMSNTAVSRAAADMKAAGLNRILAIGQPSSTPPGAKADVQAVTGKADAMSRLPGLAMAGFNTAVGVANTAADTALKNANVDASNAAATSSLASGALSNAKALQTLKSLPQTEAKSRVADVVESANSAAAVAKRKQSQIDVKGPMPAIDAALKRFGFSIPGFFGTK